MSFSFPTLETVDPDLKRLQDFLLKDSDNDSDDEESQTVKRFRTDTNCEIELERTLAQLRMKEAESEQAFDQLRIKEAELNAITMDRLKCKLYKTIVKNQKELIAFYNEWSSLAERANIGLTQMVNLDVVDADLKALLQQYEEKTGLMASTISTYNQRMTRINTMGHKLFEAAAEEEELMKPLNTSSSTSSTPSRSENTASEVRFKGKPRYAAHANQMAEARKRELEQRQANKLLSNPSL